MRAASPDAQAVVLLCSSLGSGREGVQPFGPRAYADLRSRIARASLPGPGALIGMDPDGIREALALEPDAADRVARLLARSGQLAFELDRLAARGIWVVTLGDDAYPGRLRERLGDGAPPVLFGAGDAALVAVRGVAIVGARDADEAAIAFAERLAAAVAAGGDAVVSGGARGVDVAAMRGAFERGGPVVAVLPEGIERRVREASARAAIGEGRAVFLSPYHPGAAFSAGAAMGRNKLIYALADVAVVVSSAEGSGGTWAGAAEALKARWVPVIVRRHPDAPAGNEALISLGGIAFADDGAIAPALDELLDIAAAAAPAPRAAETRERYEQARLFAD